MLCGIIVMGFHRQGHCRSPGGSGVPEVVECHWCSPAPVGSRPENLHQYWSEDRGQSCINPLVSV